jgi:hypothetical protein
MYHGFSIFDDENGNKPINGVNNTINVNDKTLIINDHESKNSGTF